MLKRKDPPSSDADPKKHHVDTPDSDTTKQIVNTPNRLHCVTANSEEQILINGINGRMAMLEEACKFLRRPFPCKVIVTETSGRMYLSIETCWLRLQNLSEPKLLLLKLVKRHYSWEELSAMISYVSGETRKETLESISRQAEEWVVNLGKLQAACMEVVEQLGRIGWKHNSLEVVTDPISLGGGTCLIWAKNHNSNNHIPMDNYVRFSELLTNFLEMFSPVVETVSPKEVVKPVSHTARLSQFILDANELVLF